MARKKARSTLIQLDAVIVVDTPKPAARTARVIAVRDAGWANPPSSLEDGIESERSDRDNEDCDNHFDPLHIEKVTQH